MLLTLDLPPEVEQQLQRQADLAQLPLAKWVEKLIADTLPQELSLTEIEQKYPDEWVLVAETAWDNHGDPLKGIIIAHNPNRLDLSEALHQFRTQNPNVITYIFFTGNPIPEGVVLVL